MVNYKEILRLASEGTSQRQIAVSVGHSRDTVSEFLAAAKVHNLSWPLDESVNRFSWPWAHVSFRGNMAIPTKKLFCRSRRTRICSIFVGMRATMTASHPSTRPLWCIFGSV